MAGIKTIDENRAALSSAFRVIAATTAFVCLPMAAHAADPPRRVVSMNLCTDQMAMMMAMPGQLYSVSDIALDKVASAMAVEAASYTINHGLAEEIFLMQPDLVLAGTYTTQATVSLLQRLGIRVETFAPDASFDDVRASLTRLGEILGRQQRAAELVADLGTRLAAMKDKVKGQPVVATWEANGYTAGSGTLVNAVIEAAGMTNLGAKLGFVGGGRLPLEMLIIAEPDLIASSGEQYADPALAEQNVRHPAFRHLAEGRSVNLPSRYTICGAPFTTEAVRLLVEGAASARDIR